MHSQNQRGGDGSWISGAMKQPLRPCDAERGRASAQITSNSVPGITRLTTPSIRLQQDKEQDDRPDGDQDE